MPDPTISCDVCRELLSALSDGEVPALEPAALAHLEDCAACREFRDDLGAVRSALRGWADEFPPENVRLFARNVSRPFRALRLLAAAAVLVVAIAVGFAAGRATAPGAPRIGDIANVAPEQAPPVERERFVVPDRNEIHSTISLAAVEKRDRDISERSDR